MNLLIPPAMFYKDGFGIKWPMKVDMSLNKKINNFITFLYFVKLENIENEYKQITYAKLNC